MVLICPGCQNVIHRSEAEAAPRRGVTYRCHICRLELIVNAEGGAMPLAPYRADEENYAQSSRKTRPPTRQAEAADRPRRE